jgi:simple sugar transport system permease protein
MTAGGGMGLLRTTAVVVPMKKLWKYHETYVALVIIILACVITSLNPNFLTLENLFDLLKSYTFLGILAIGVLFVLISGGIDISFTAVATVAVYATMSATLQYGGNVATVFLMSAVIGATLGLINAMVIYFFNIHSIITTIATLNVFYGLLTVVSGGTWLYNMPDWFRQFAETNVLSLVNANGIPYGLSIISVIWLVVIAAAWMLLRYTTLGRGIYAMGGNPASAERAGFNILGMQAFVYCFMGLLAGIAGVVEVMLAQRVAPNSMVGKELDVIAAVVLGGASLAGGVGTLPGTLLGVALIAIIGNGLTLMRISSFWYNVFIGLTIIVSVGVSAYRRKLQRKRAIAVEVE